MARRWAIVLLAVVAGQLLGVRAASAHSVLLSSSPADGQVLASAPKVIELRFTEAVDARATVITLVDGAGQQWRPLSVHRTGDATIVAQLPTLAKQTYRLTWRTVSSDDRHATSGVVVFGVATAATSSAPVPADPVPAWREVLLWWTLLVATGGLVGGLLLDVIGSRLRRPLVLSVALANGAVAVLVAPALFVVHGAGARLLGSDYGLRSIVRECGLVLLVLLVQVARRQPPAPARTALAVVAAGVVALASALLGHTATSPARTVLGATHLLAALIWFGTLWVLGVTIIVAARSRERLRPALIAALLPFGRVALASVATLVVTGVLLTGDSASTVDSLFTSVFGRLLGVKLALAVVAGLLGWRTHLGLRANRPRVRMRVLAMEGGVLAAVLLAAAALSSAAPPQGLRFEPGRTVAGSQTVSGEVDGLLEAVTVGPNRPGHNFVTAEVYNSRRPAPAPIDSVAIGLSSPDGEQVELVTAHDSSGRWVASTEGLDRAGDWTVSVTVHRPGMSPTAATYPWRVGGNIGGPARRIVSSAAVAPLAGVAAFVLSASIGLAVVGRRRRAGVPTVRVVRQVKRSLPSL